MCGSVLTLQRANMTVPNNVLVGSFSTMWCLAQAPMATSTTIAATVDPDG